MKRKTIQFAIVFMGLSCVAFGATLTQSGSDTGAKSNAAAPSPEITVDDFYTNSDGYAWAKRITDSKNKLVCIVSYVIGGAGTAGGGTAVSCQKIE